MRFINMKWYAIGCHEAHSPVGPHRNVAADASAEGFLNLAVLHGWDGSCRLIRFTRRPLRVRKSFGRNRPHCDVALRLNPAPLTRNLSLLPGLLKPQFRHKLSIWTVHFGDFSRIFALIVMGTSFLLRPPPESQTP